MGKKKIKVFWEDAVIYSKPKSLDINPTEKVTEGELVINSQEFIVVKNPKTQEDPKQPKFYYIPKGMIKKIVEA